MRHQRDRRDRRHDGCNDGNREQRDQKGPGPDTRFLQLEMSRLLYSEAEAVTRDAFRELLIEAAKNRLRERFGNEIIGLAEVAVDEWMHDVCASLDIEARIQERGDDRTGIDERLRNVFRGSDDGGDNDE